MRLLSVEGKKMAENESQRDERIRWERDNKDKENANQWSLDFQTVRREDICTLVTSLLIMTKALTKTHRRKD